MTRHLATLRFTRVCWPSGRSTPPVARAAASASSTGTLSSGPDYILSLRPPPRGGEADRPPSSLWTAPTPVSWQRAWLRGHAYSCRCHYPWMGHAALSRLHLVGRTWAARSRNLMVSPPDGHADRRPSATRQALPAAPPVLSQGMPIGAARKRAHAEAGDTFVKRVIVTPAVYMCVSKITSLTSQALGRIHFLSIRKLCFY